MGGTTSLEIILKSQDAGYFKNPQAIAKLRVIHQYLDNHPEIGKVISLVNFTEELNKLMDAAFKELGPMAAMLDRDTLLPLPKILEHVPRDMLGPYVSDDFAQARIFIRVRETAPELVRNELITDIRAFLASRSELKGLSPRLSGIFLLYSNMLNSLVSSQLWTFWVVFAAIYIMFLVLFRSPQVALYAMIPNVLPVLVILGIMGFTGVHLDMMTIMIASVSLGIGADGAIHYIFRYRKELDACGDYVQAAYRSHASIGRAILFTSIVVIAGFWVLVFSNFAPTFYFGLFTGLAMLAALTGSLVLLPLCLVTFKPMRPKKE
jgi:predicted RND superfamily exporter protein